MYEKDQPSGYAPDKYDRMLGQLAGLPGMAHTKPTTIRVTPPLGIGGSASYNVTTYRQAGETIPSDEGEKEKRTPATFTVFLEIVEGDTAKRIVLPNDVCALIVRQRDALTAIAQRKAARQAAKTRKARGHRPTFGRKG